jgi:hypothetical protein
MEMTQFKIDQSQNLFLELTITATSFQPIDTQKVKLYLNNNNNNNK